MNTLRSQIFVLLLLIPILSRSQNTIEPYIGYGIDLGNKVSFSQANAGLQYPVINHQVYQMLIRVQGGLPLSGPSGAGLIIRCRLEEVKEWFIFKKI